MGKTMWGVTFNFKGSRRYATPGDRMKMSKKNAQSLVKRLSGSNPRIVKFN